MTTDEPRGNYPAACLFLQPIRPSVLQSPGTCRPVPKANGDCMRCFRQPRKFSRRRTVVNPQPRAVLRAALALGGIAVFTPANAWADPTPAAQAASAPLTTQPVSSSPEVERLLAQFQSDNWRIRDQAQDALAAMSQAVEPRLRQFVRTTTNAEARARARIGPE